MPLVNTGAPSRPIIADHIGHLAYLAIPMADLLSFRTMNTAQKTAKNFGAIVLCEAVGKVVTFYAIVVHLAGYLSKDQFGTYNLVFAYISFCFLLANFGMDRIIVREISRTPDRIRSITGSAILVKGVLAFVAFALANLFLFVAGDWLNYSPQLATLIRIASVGILLSVFSVFGAVLHFRLELQKRSMATIIARLLGAGAMIALVALDAPFAWFVIAGLLVGGRKGGLPQTSRPVLLWPTRGRRAGKNSDLIRLSKFCTCRWVSGRPARPSVAGRPARRADCSLRKVQRLPGRHGPVV